MLLYFSLNLTQYLISGSPQKKELSTPYNNPNSWTGLSTKFDNRHLIPKTPIINHYDLLRENTKKLINSPIKSTNDLPPPKAIRHQKLEKKTVKFDLVSEIEQTQLEQRRNIIDQAFKQLVRKNLITLQSLPTIKNTHPSFFIDAGTNICRIMNKQHIAEDYREYAINRRWDDLLLHVYSLQQMAELTSLEAVTLITRKIIALFNQQTSQPIDEPTAKNITQQVYEGIPIKTPELLSSYARRQYSVFLQEHNPRNSQDEWWHSISHLVQAAIHWILTALHYEDTMPTQHITQFWDCLCQSIHNKIELHADQLIKQYAKEIQSQEVESFIAHPQ
ncbi:MAG: hypothetical protein CL816_08360 [Coxiellaceae bacterium]|nr:hypothetical protein [Coxiellaceae bacterium]